MKNAEGGIPAHPNWSVRPVREGDERRWRELYAGYRAFYGVEQTDETASLVWSWLLDPDSVVEGIVAIDSSGEIGGLAHYREFPRPLLASIGCYLDDLFVDPELRGQGAVDALLEELKRIARTRDWSTIRWITADDNYRARGKYDKFATRTPWITYDMQP
jgi:ribosomal protein S18 acetylase RimI-like enzyme